MNLDKKSLAYARLALHQAGRDFLFDPNVNLIDFGLPSRGGKLSDGDLAIRIHVSRKLSGHALESAIEAGQTAPIPDSIAGFKTDVPVGAYNPNLWGWGGSWRRPSSKPRAKRASVLVGGISISDQHRHTYGTLGGLVYDHATGEPMILSNWHVLAGRWGTRKGQRIYQPGRRDGGNWTDTVAYFTRDAMSVDIDAAVAKINDERPFKNFQLELDPVAGVGEATLGMEVVKSGRGTGVTYGRVTGIEGVARMRYDRIERIMKNIVTIERRNSYEPDVSAGGDSGSWWLDLDTNRAIGLHFAGSNSPIRAIAHDMSSVLNALNVQIIN